MSHKPICDCGNDLCLVRYPMIELVYKITSEGQLAKRKPKLERTAGDDTFIPRLKCYECKKQYYYHIHNNMIIRGDNLE